MWSRVLAISAGLLVSCPHVHGQVPDVDLKVDGNLVLVDALVIDSVSG